MDLRRHGWQQVRGRTLSARAAVDEDLAMSKQNSRRHPNILELVWKLVPR